MGWYDKGLRIDPSLVSMTGGVGKGMAAFGNSLVSLGDQKIKKAKEDAAKKEKEANKRATMSATFSKNNALNPQAVQRINKQYGIDPSSPAYEVSKARRDISLIDLGKADKKPAPTALTSYIGNKGIKHTTMSDGSTIDSKYPVQTTTKTPTVVMSYIGPDNYKYTRMSDKSVIKSKFPVKQKEQITKAPKRTSYWDPEKQANMVKQWDGKKFVKTGEYAAQYNQPGTNKPNYVSIDSLTPAQRYFARTLGVVTKDKDNRVVVDKNILTKKQNPRGSMSQGKDKIFGDEGGY